MTFFFVFLCIFSGIFAIDFLVKYFLLHVLNGQAFYFIDGWFGLDLHYNKFIAFSIPIGFWLLMLINVLLIGFLFYLLFVYWRKNVNISKKIVVTLLLCGALLNFIDRVLYSYVIDYITIWRFPVFNFADILIVGGALSWLYLEYKEQSPRSSTDRTVSS